MSTPIGLITCVTALISSSIGGTFDDLQDYARRLLASFPDPSISGVRIKLPAEAISPVPQQGKNGSPWTGSCQAEDGKRLEREMERAEEGGLTGCREAVEILTRNPKKGTKNAMISSSMVLMDVFLVLPASYDVNKDGVKVAILTFPKAAYRLGETVLGVVELNDRKNRARVLQVQLM